MDLSLQDALSRGYANYSGVARLLKPRIEKTLARRVKLESVITSVKRARSAYKATPLRIKDVLAKSAINLRTDVAKVSVEKSRRTLQVVRRTLAEFKGEFLQVLEGITAITFIIDSGSFGQVHALFRKEEILDESRDLAAIVLQSPAEIIDAPGCIAAFYTEISRMQVNIEETASCFTDTIIILQMQDVSKAFSALTALIAQARK